MRHRTTTALAMIGLCAAWATPAKAQEYRFTGFDGPGGTTATLNLRVPLGAHARVRTQRPSLGFTAGHARSQVLADPGARPMTRQLQLLDLRIDGSGLSRARMAGVDLAPLDGGGRLAFQDDEPRRNRAVRLVLIGLLGVAAGVGAEMLLDGSEDEETPGTAPTPPGPG